MLISSTTLYQYCASYFFNTTAKDTLATSLDLTDRLIRFFFTEMSKLNAIDDYEAIREWKLQQKILRNYKTHPYTYMHVCRRAIFYVR